MNEDISLKDWHELLHESEQQQEAYRTHQQQRQLKQEAFERQKAAERQQWLEQRTDKLSDKLVSYESALPHPPKTRPIMTLESFIEDYLRPASFDVFEPYNIEVSFTARTSTSWQGEEKLEVDFLAKGTVATIAMDVKSHCIAEDVMNFVAKMKDFRRFFQSKPSAQVYGAIAGIEISYKAQEYAHHSGLFILYPVENTITIANPPNFIPRIW